MIFCRRCGADIPDNAKRCPGCGATVEEARKASEGETVAGDIFSRIADMFNMKDETSSFENYDKEYNRKNAATAYIPFLFFLPLIKTSASGFVRFHVNQGILLFALELVWTALCVFIIISLASLSALQVLFGWIFGIGYFILSLYIFCGIVTVYNRRAIRFPLIGSFDILR